MRRHNLARDFFNSSVLKPAMLEFLENDGDINSCSKRVFEPIRVQIIETKQMLIVSDGFHMVASDFTADGWAKFKSSVPSSLTFDKLNFTLLNITQWRFQFTPTKKGHDLNNLTFKLIIEQAHLVSTDRFQVGGNPYALMNDFEVQRFLQVFKHQYIISKTAEMTTGPMMKLEEVHNLRHSKKGVVPKKALGLDKLQVSNADFENDLPESTIDIKDLITYEAVARQKFTGQKTKKEKPSQKGALAHPRNVTKEYHALAPQSPSKAKDKKKPAPTPAPVTSSPEPKWLTPARVPKPSKKLMPSGPPRSTSPKITRNPATPAGRLAKGLKNLVQGDTSPAVTAIKQIAGKRKEAKEGAKDKHISQSSLTRFKEWKKGKGGRGKQTLTLDLAKSSTKFTEIKDTAPAVLIQRPKRGAAAVTRSPAVARKVGQRRPPPSPPKKAATKPTKKTRRS